MKKILDFRNRSYSDVSGKYQSMEKPLKHQRRIGLAAGKLHDRITISEDLNWRKHIDVTVNKANNTVVIPLRQIGSRRLFRC